MFYVYAYLDPLKPGRFLTSNISFLFEPFYIGKGKNKRAYCHTTKGELNKNTHKSYRIKSIISQGQDPFVILLYKDIVDEQIALELETSLISELGTRSLICGGHFGPLTNQKLEGQNAAYSLESRQKMSNSAKSRPRKPHSEETKAKMRESSKKYSEIRSLRCTQQFKGKKLSKQRCDGLSALHKGKTISAEHRASISKYAKERIRTPEECKQISLRQNKSYEILVENTGHIIVVDDLNAWCQEQSIKYNTIFGTYYRQKFHKGFKIIKKYGGTHF